MFNTKRIKALQEAITMLSRESFNALERITKIERKEIPNIISCSTCKCLIKKEDAIRGKSEVDNKIYQFHELECDIKYEVVYESAITNKPIGFNKLLINTPYYCHSKDCKPKKLK